MNVCFSLPNTLKNLLGNLTDKLDMKEKSGIYKIACSDCDKAYIGQMKQAIGTRFNDHIRCYRYRKIESSSVAQHINETAHNIKLENLKLIKNFAAAIDAYGTVYIKRNTNLMKSVHETNER